MTDELTRLAGGDVDRPDAMVAVQPRTGGQGSGAEPGRGSGTLEVFERRGQAKRLVQDERAAVHGLDYVPTA